MPGGVSGQADSDAIAQQNKNKPAPKGTLTANTVYQLAVEAGFSTSGTDPKTGLSLAKTMVAISWDESSFKETIVNSIGCVGLWQINPVHFKEAAFTSHGWNTNTLKEGHANAQAAKVIYDQQGLTAWTTYKHGLSAYAIGAAKSSDKAGAAPDMASGGLGIPNPLSGLEGAFQSLSGTLLKLGLNLGAVALALVLLILGVVILLHKQEAVAAKVAAKVIP